MTDNNDIGSGLDHHRAGRVEKAEAIYRKVLAADPGNAEALHLLGIIAHERGNHRDAVDLIGRAIAASPDRSIYHYHLGNAHVGLGQVTAAAEAFFRASELDAASFDATYNLALARRQEGDLVGAADSYRRAMALRPNDPRVPFNLGNIFEEMGQSAEAMTFFRKALGLDPGFVEAMINLGVCLKNAGRIEEAEQYLELALRLRPGAVEADETLRDMRSRLLPRWHFPMLNDTSRNSAYDRAIRRAVTPDALVLDIGTGSGLLAMMAARAGARVVVCEMVKPLARVAERIVAANGYADKISVVAKKSTELVVGVDLAARADVLISEILDMGLIGERMLPTLRHAMRNLVRDDARIVPMGAVVHAAAIECPFLRPINPIRGIAGFDLSNFDSFHSAGYTDIDLEVTPHRLLSEPVAALKFDFRNIPLGGRWQALGLAITASGTCHGIVFWFDLHLDESTVLSSRSRDQANHWKQAGMFLDQDLPVTAGSELPIIARHNDWGIRFDLAAGA